MDGKELGERLLHPMTADDEKNACVDGWGERGITLRQHFAGLAMQGLCSRPAHHDPMTIASESIAMADALLAELAKPAALSQPATQQGEK